MPLHTLWIHVWIPRHSLGEFPHSDICGSMLIYSSPQLFAVSHVLHRRQVPRHPPYALCSLIFFKSLSALKSHITSLVSLCILSKISYIVNCSYYSLLFIFRYFFLIDEISCHPVTQNLLCSCQCALSDNSRLWGCDYSHWWAQVDSNYRPHAYQACALTN